MEVRTLIADGLATAHTIIVLLGHTLQWPAQAPLLRPLRGNPHPVKPIQLQAWLRLDGAQPALPRSQVFIPLYIPKRQLD